MTRKRMSLSEAEQKALQVAYDNCRDGGTKVRYQAVRLYGKGMSVPEIQAITGCSRTSLLEWCRSYRADGIAGLVYKRRGGTAAKHTPAQVEAIQRLVHQYSPAQLFGPAVSQGTGEFWSVPAIAKLVEERMGVVYRSCSSYRHLLRKCGLSVKRPAAQYKSRTEVNVMDCAEALEKN
jgi:transposase